MCHLTLYAPFPIIVKIIYTPIPTFFRFSDNYPSRARATPLLNPPALFADVSSMPTLDPTLWFLVTLGALVMAAIMLRSIGLGAVSLASSAVDARRALVVLRSKENAEAEATGRAAALEPLCLNPDGSIEEPILAEVESPA